MVEHTCNPSTWEAEAGDLKVLGQTVLRSKKIKSFNTLALLCRDLCYNCRTFSSPWNEILYTLSSHFPFLLSLAPWQLVNWFLSLCICFLWIFHISKIILWVTFNDWLLLLRIMFSAGYWWLMPVILATHEAEIRGSQPRQIVHKTLSQKNQTQKTSAGGMPQVVARCFICLASVRPWVQTQETQKNKNKNNVFKVHPCYGMY
jgi:hypothetical protein